MHQTIRIATFNLENFDDKPNQKPSLADRIKLMRPQLLRLNADIICFQEVNGQEVEGEPRQLLALKKFLSGTNYEHYNIVSTKTADNYQVYDERNLVIASRFDIVSHHQYRNDKIEAPAYRKVTAIPAEEAKDVDWERPILLAEVKLQNNRSLHIINLHLKSKIPTTVSGQKIGSRTWKSASGWAEGYFLSSMKRVGQALETRIVIDELINQDEDAMLVVCGDFNADQDSVPVMAIRGDVENTENGDLSNRVLFPCENGIPKSSRYSLFHRGKKEMLDHLLISRNMLSYYKHTEIHNEMLHDESIAFATDKKYPESDHAPIVTEFHF